jgi:hypothetical protein
MEVALPLILAASLALTFITFIEFARGWSLFFLILSGCSLIGLSYLYGGPDSDKYWYKEYMSQSSTNGCYYTITKEKKWYSTVDRIILIDIPEECSTIQHIIDENRKKYTFNKTMTEKESK